MKQPVQPVGESEAFWHLALRTDHLEKSLEAAVNAGCEVTVPIRPLDLLNDVTQRPWPGARCFLSVTRERTVAIAVRKLTLFDCVSAHGTCQLRQFHYDEGCWKRHHDETTPNRFTNSRRAAKA